MYKIRNSKLKIFFITIFFCGAFGFAKNSNAAPSISTVSGTLSHGGTITITGTGFGTKVGNQSPMVWDNCSGTNITDKWSGGWPDSDAGSNYMLAYRTPAQVTGTQSGSGVALPHSHITKYMSGAAYPGGGNNIGNAVEMWKAFSTPSFPITYYFSGYVSVDPGWDPSQGSPVDNNYKTFDWSYTGTPYGDENGGYWYSSYCPPGDLSNVEWCFGGEAPIYGNDIHGHSVWWDGGTSPLGHWVKQEWEVKIAQDNTGYVKVWDNGSLVVNYMGITDNYSTSGGSGSYRNISIGGYNRSYPSTRNWRYFADLYLDSTPQRILLCTGSTWNDVTSGTTGDITSTGQRGTCEVQIPSSWSATSITATVNQGALASDSTVYAYIVDSTGVHNTSGKSIILGSGSGDTTAPSAPSGLSVS